MSGVSVILITRNEERNVSDCIASLPFAREIVVLDSGSTDGTEAVCRRDPRVRWFLEEWKGFGAQKNSALEKAEGPWIFSIDADERATDDLAKEIARVVSLPDGPPAYRVARKNFFGERWVRRGGWYPDYTIRLWRKESGRFAARSVHESVRVEGRVGTLKGNLLHYTYRDTADYLERMNLYSTLAASELRRGGRTVSPVDLLARPAFAFLRMYVLRLGFLEGALGFRLATLYAMYTFAKYAKAAER